MATGSFYVLLGLALCLAVGSAFFSALETALFLLQPMELERLRRKKTYHAEALSEVLSNPRRLLNVILLADVLFNVPLMVICLSLLGAEVFPGLPFWAKALALLGVVVFLCDLVPKMVGMLNPYRLIRLGLVLMIPTVRGLAVPVRILQGLCDRAVDRLLPQGYRSGHVLDEDEVSTLVELGAEEGALHMSESAMIQSLIRLGDKTVRDCMSPRVDAVLFSDDLTNEELREKLHGVRYRRVPVYGATPDDVLGVLEVRRFLESEEELVHYTALLTPPSFVPETMKALDLLRSFLRRAQGMAIVVDEHGGTEGVITRADLVEEIIADALPGGDRELYIEALGDGRFVASGLARLEDVADLLHLDLRVEGIDTVGGLAFHLAGQLPRPGDVLEGEGMRLSVRRTMQKRVEEVLVQRLESGGGIRKNGAEGGGE